MSANPSRAADGRTPRPGLKRADSRQHRHKRTGKGVARPSLAVRLYRIGSYLAVLATAALLATLALRPEIGLTILWQLLIPVVPLVLFIAPVLWRNLCPIAALHQLPRHLNLSLNLRAPRLLVRYSYVVAMLLLFGMVGARHFLFESNGPVLALVIVAVLLLALLQGILFRGKSAWCNGLCPVRPVGTLYGRGPFIELPNAHCTTCVGCSLNCFDATPYKSALADIYGKDEQRLFTRRLFAAAFPGFVYAFFVVPIPPEVTVLAMYGSLAGWMAVSMALYMTLEALSGLSIGLLTAVFGAAALNIYYFFTAPALAKTVAGLLGATALPSWAAWAVTGLQVMLALLSMVWLWRLAKRDRTYRQNRKALVRSGDKVVAPVRFLPNAEALPVVPGTTLLAAAEAQGIGLAPAHRQDACDDTPVRVVEGAENLIPPDKQEREALQRLGMGADIRLAGRARVRGPVTGAPTRGNRHGRPDDG